MITITLIILYYSYALLYRISQCPKENELFSLCTWKCPPTCINLRLLWNSSLVCPKPWECRTGCQCKPGYIKDEYSKDCVLVQQCPESAPTHLKDGQAERPVPHLRRVHKVKRSNAAFSYETPCAAAARARAAAASSAVPVIAAPAGYHFIPDERYAHSYASELPYYREDDSEMLQFSDMDQMMSRNIPTHHYPTARGYQPYHQYAAVSSVPSLAMFPGTDGKKGCGAVPLLFSCSPSIVQGQLGHAHPYYNYQEPVPVVHGYPEYHYAVEEPLAYRQVAPEFIEEDRQMHQMVQPLAMNQHFQAMNQQALQQQAMQRHALNQQSEQEQLRNQHEISQQKNDKSAEKSREVESHPEIPLNVQK